MKNLTLKIKDFDILSSIKQTLELDEPLNSKQKNTLLQVLNDLPKTEHFLERKISLDIALPIKLLSISAIERNLEQWRKLFEIIPGYDGVPRSYITIEQTEIGEQLRKLLNDGVLIVASFSPSITYDLNNRGEGIDIHLMDDGSAKFVLTTLVDAEKYPELYHFNGTWTEAYYLMIETMKNGWPLEEFPKELRTCLP